MCKAITGYFLRLSDRRTPDGRKEYLRVSCGHLTGKRWVGTESEAKAALLREIDRGNLTAQLRPAYGPLPSSSLPESAPRELRGFAFVPRTGEPDKSHLLAPDAQDYATESSYSEAEAAWRAAIIKAPADLTDEDRRVLAANVD